MSNLVKQVEDWLEWEDLKYAKDEPQEGITVFYFGVQGKNSLGMLFLVEEIADCVQFRVIDVLDDDDKEILKDNEKAQMDLMKYLLEKNYEKRFGKWTADFDDWSINFTLAHYEKPDGKIDKSLFKLVRGLLFDDVDNMISDIKHIIRGEELEDDDDVDLEALLELLKSGSKDSEGSV